MHLVPSARPVVWIVDDSPLDAERARRVLEPDHKVEVFGDGSALLEQLASRPAPDLLVLDWVMPGVSGIEVCRFLRGAAMPHPEMAILLLTMQTQTEQIVEGLAAGANDYLVKPYADPELRARVEALLRSKKLLERAQKAEASVLALLEHAPDPLVGVDGQYRVTYANGEAQRALGRAADSLLGRPLSEALPKLPLDQLADAVVLLRPLPDIEIGDQIFSPTVRALPSDAHSGLTISLRNVTARRQKESRRLDFYSIIAHDLRSPLGAMLMRAEILLRGGRGVLAPEQAAELRKMESHIRSLVALINDFLDFARMEEAAHKMELARVDLATLLTEIIEDFKPLVENTRQRIEVDARPGQAWVLGDRRRLQQVVTNLIANAIKFTPAGGNIMVSARLKDRRCEVVVEDDGAGIDPGVLPTLFQRYSRGPTSKSTKDADGTGLGLLIVREIIEAHGGDVGVESAPGQGSRFWFRLTAIEPSVAPPVELATTP
jgi:two-component system phosphate regulon sensor histidine kinase PhoR